MTATNPLARLETAHRMLAEARTVDEVKEVRDKAVAAATYAKERGMALESIQFAQEIALRAERKAGELLAEMPKHPPGPVPSADTRDLPPKLSDLGITYDQSSQWQQLAKIPEPDFERGVADAKAEEIPLTTARVIDLARNGFDPSTLPPSRMSRAEYAYFAVPKLMQWLDVDPDEVAEAADFDRLSADMQSWMSVVVWVEKVVGAMERRQNSPIQLVKETA